MSKYPSLKVTKRNGQIVPFDAQRITRAICLAIHASKYTEVNTSRDTAPYGVSQEHYDLAEDLTAKVVKEVVSQYGKAGIPSVEDVQAIIELQLLKSKQLDVVHYYISYRQQQASLRPATHGESGLQDFLANTKYTRFREDLGRREVWAEATQRVRDMHHRRFAAKNTDLQSLANKLLETGIISAQAFADMGPLSSLSTEIDNVFAAVEKKEVLPSMRSMQFGGEAIETANARIYNCSYGYVNRVAFFKEYFYLLLCGCGVGFSVQKHHVAKLPMLAPRGQEIDLPVKHIEIADTIEGWADALNDLIQSYIQGYHVEFGYGKIRNRGAQLKTSGGKAPGHLPLKTALVQCEQILAGATGRQLRPIEVYDICMFVAKAVLSGGIRRSATICLFSPDDEEMMNAKADANWFVKNPQRSASNNSAIIVRSEATREMFDKLFAAQKGYGEPGFYFAESKEYGCNPCVEIGLNPTLTSDCKDIAKLKLYGYKGAVQEGDELTGFQFCNLSTIAGRAATNAKNFFRLVRDASLIGTLQADYTDIPYLGAVTRVINERESLIGVSICGVLDQPEVLLDPETLRRGAEVVKAVNTVVSAAIGINRAARTTCVKPEGTSSLVLNSGSGINPWHSRRHFRRVQCTTADPLTAIFEQANPHMVEKSVYDPSGATKVATFPVEAPEHAICATDVNALQHLQYVKIVQENWVIPGRAHTIYSNCHHNVSNTINVEPENWDKVADFIWNNRDLFTGVALLSKSGDKDYPQAPRENVVTREDILKWNSLVYNPVDYTQDRQGEDATTGSEHRGAAVACAGGACSLD